MCKHVVELGEVLNTAFSVRLNGINDISALHQNPQHSAGPARQGTVHVTGSSVLHTDSTLTEYNKILVLSKYSDVSPHGINAILKCFIADHRF